MFDPLAECRDMAYIVAPELRGAPLYLLTAPTGYLLPDDCNAFATRSTDYAIRQQLVDRSKWRGPGNHVVFGSLPDHQEDLLGLLLHEVAHLLPCHPFPPEDREPSREQINHQVALNKRWATEPDTTNRPPWEPCHGEWFTRCVLHLHFRATQNGIDVPLPCLCAAGQRYGLSGAWRYRQALGDEPARLIKSTFHEIHATDPPDEFTELFNADVAHYHRFRSTQHAT